MAAPSKPSTAAPTKREHLLDCVERLMIDEGYAAVTYRALATRAGVTAPLVQYYFPSIDDLFVAAVRRRAEQSLQRLQQTLAERPNQPLRVLWEFSRQEASAALMTEFTALGNHRKSIAAVIAEVTEEVRKVELAALRAKWTRDGAADGGLSAEATLFLLTAVPKIIKLEASVGVSLTHKDVIAGFESYLDSVEPLPATGRASTTRKTRILPS